jgi:hypothetical protein
MTQDAISKADVGSDFENAYQLDASGTTSPTVYLTTTVVSTTSGTQTVVINLPSNGEGILNGRDNPANPGDYVVLSGTSGADGTYTIATVVSDTSFTVVGTINTSTGGSVNFEYPPGASKIGVDPAGLCIVTDTTVQGAIEQLDTAVCSSTTSIETLNVVLPAQYDEVTGVVTGLAGTPVGVIGISMFEVGVVVQSGMVYAFSPYQLNANGFNWKLKVLGDEFWPGPGSVTIRVSYIWSTT